MYCMYFREVHSGRIRKARWWKSSSNVLFGCCDLLPSGRKNTEISKYQSNGCITVNKGV